MAYDPTAQGARCDLCILSRERVALPVPPEMNAGSTFLCVAEAPGEEEVRHGRPLCGPSGQELMKAFGTIGVNRGDASFTNSCMCRPPANDMDKVLARLKRQNDIRAKAGLDPLPKPWQCCRPRLVQELRQFPNWIALGSEGYASILNFDVDKDVIITASGKRFRKYPPITAARGFPLALQLMANGQTFSDDNCKFDGAHSALMMPTLHPAFVLRQRRWTKIFRSDIARALRLFRGEYGWTDPKMNLMPTPAQLREFLLQRREPFWSVDAETDGKEPLTCKLRCIGFSTCTEALLVPLLSIDGRSSFYLGSEYEEILDIMRTFFTDRTRIKYGWNYGYFDTIVIQQRLGVTPVPVVDGIMLHHVVDSELPHSLGFVGSYYIEPPRAWKADHTATMAKTDVDLHTYCVSDCVVTARLQEPLVAAVELRRQMEVTKLDHRMQQFCAGLHTIGMKVDPVRRAARDKLAMFGETLTDGAVIEKGIIHYEKTCKLASGNLDFKPGSYPGVRKLLFERWGMPIDQRQLTQAGVPSTKDEVLLALLARGKALRAEQAEFLHALRWYRKKTKERGTYIVKLKRCDEPIDPNDIYVEDDDDWEIREELKDPNSAKRIRRPKMGCVMMDGRMHADWNAHTPATGRLSSSNPNAQNIPKHLRDMFICEPGHKLVGVDMDQLELRMVSACAGAARDLETFHRAVKLKKSGKEPDKLDPAQDPYSATAAAIFGKEWAAADVKNKKRIRHFSKIFRLAAQYGAEPQTVWQVIRSAEDDNGRLIFLDITLRETREKHDAWCESNPEIVTWWGKVWEEYRRQGYLCELVGGRRRDFLDGEEEVVNEVRNFRGQSGSASLMNKATIEIVDNIIPFGKWGPTTGIINQCHDALVAEVPEAKAERICHEMEEALETVVPGLDVTFTATGEIGDNLAQV